ncbi:hypothetical protein [Streptomyces sp. NPDC002990]
MRGKLAALAGLFTFALALGLGFSGEQNDQADTTAGYTVQAENKGPNTPAPAPGL